MKLLLIDGHYYMYRSFYAIRELSNSRGQQTNAIYGFIKTVRKMLRDTSPDRVAVLWDQGLPQRRVELQPDYKATRAETPAGLDPQIDFIRDTAPLMGLTSIGVKNTEADDLIAAYAVAARAQGAEVILATNDKDLFQLVDEKCRVYSTNKTDADPATGFGLLGEEQVREKWGVPPGQIGEVLALIGDAVDNIPGIEGIGNKTAVALLKEHGSLDALLANVDRVKNERIRGKLRDGLAQIRSNREMVRLETDLPLPVPMEEMVIRPRWPELIAALEWCEFKGLFSEIKAEAEKAGQAGAPSVSLPAAAPPPPRPSRPAQGELF
jgi:DNA polymerase-1